MKELVNMTNNLRNGNTKLNKTSNKFWCNRPKLSPKSLVLSPLIALLLLLAFPVVAAAHPLGNFTVNAYSRLEISATGLNIHYVLDMAEIPAFQEKDGIDTNRDGQISETERNTYMERKVKEIQANLILELDGTRANLKIVAQDLSFPAGQGGLQTLRLTANFETPALNANVTTLNYRDTNFNDRLGWREIVVRNGNGVALQQSSVPSTDKSNELRTYPEDMLASPLALTSARASFKLDPSVRVAGTPAAQITTDTAKSQDAFASLINGELTLPVIALALLLAMALGAVHALSPGHGKTVVAAYLVGTRGTPRHAVFLGLTVTVTHTIGVFTLGLITLFASQFILPEKLYPWLGLASGLIVVIMGLSMTYSRLRKQWSVTNQPDHSHDQPHSEHSHDHDDHAHNHSDHTHNHDGHSHDHHSHDRAHEPATDHQPLTPVFRPTTNDQRPLTAIGAADGAAIMERTALVVEADHIHDQAHLEHSHDHSDHSHDHDHDDHHSNDHHDHSHDDHHSHDHDHTPITAYSHSHGGKVHSHLPPGADGTEVTWKRLLMFGISAGLLPCPSALIVMLSAIALGRVAFGLVLIVFFSFGLAATLTAIGLMLIYARNWLARSKIKPNGRFLRIVPVVSAFVIVIIGLAISYEAILQIGR